MCSMNEAAVRKVALNSRAKAEAHLSQENWGRAFAHLLLCVKLESTWRAELQSAISNCLCYWGEQLEKEGRHEDLLHCYQQALEAYPDDHEVLTNLGAHLFRQMEVWLKVLSSLRGCTSSAVRRNLSKVVLSFEIISAGIKPAFVWDFYNVELHNLQTVVSELISLQLIHPQTSVLILQNGDLLVVHGETLLRTLRSEVLVMDVSGLSGATKIIEKRAEVEEMRASIHLALNSESRLVEIRPEIRGPTMTGLLLGYPMLYWMRPDAEENCLGNVSLAVFEVTGTCSGSEKKQLLTSFSVPVSLIDSNLRVRVKNWFEENFVTVEQSIIGEIVLTEKAVCLPQVVLFGHLREAKDFFERALLANKDYLPAAHNLENLASALVERWHFRMLNDSVRNESFREAIQKKIRQGYSNVLDIGTGTSLLSLYAATSGAKSVFACECSPAMAEIASDVIRGNGAANKIELIPKLSNDLAIPQDLPSRMSLVVTETMDAGLLGEHVLETLIDAWDRLLLPPSPNPFSAKDSARHGIVIPYSSTVFVAGVRCPYVARGSFLSADDWSALGLTDGPIRLGAVKEEEYNSEDLTHLPDGFALLTSPVEALRINFNNPGELKSLFTEEKLAKVQLTCCEPGQIDAIVSWFVLQLDEDLKLTSKPGQDSCWEQAVFSLDPPLEVHTGQKIIVGVSAANGMLRVQAPNEHTNIDEKIDSQALRCLNDPEWICALRGLADTFEGKSELVVLDLSPFPYLGLLLVKRGIAKHLGHRCQNEDLIAKIVQQGQTELVGDVSLIPESRKYDLVLIDPVTSHGELDQETILNLPTIKKHLTQSGEIFPKKLSIVGQLWNSPWLELNSQLVSDENVSDFKISDTINNYQISKYLDLHVASAEFSALSSATNLLTCDLSEVMEETRVSAVESNLSGVATALPFWFELELTDTIKYSTNNTASYVNQAAVLLRPNLPVVENFNVIFRVRCVSGLFDVQVAESE